jgi:hypothetical protein
VNYLLIPAFGDSGAPPFGRAFWDNRPDQPRAEAAIGRRKRQRIAPGLNAAATSGLGSRHGQVFDLVLVRAAAARAAMMVAFVSADGPKPNVE